MQTNTFSNGIWHHLRFLIGVPLVLTLSAGAWFAGRAYGNREGTARALGMSPANLRATSRGYDVRDVVSNPSISGPSQIDFDSFMAEIEKKCSPDTWALPGSPGHISPSPLHYTLMNPGGLSIRAYEPVHSQIDSLLLELRKAKYGPDFHVQYRGIVRSPRPRAKIQQTPKKIRRF